MLIWMTSHLNVTVIISNVCSIENDTAFLFSMLSFWCHFFLDLQYIEFFCVMYSVYCKSNFLRIAFSVISAYDRNNSTSRLSPGCRPIGRFRRFSDAGDAFRRDAVDVTLPVLCGARPRRSVVTGDARTSLLLLLRRFWFRRFWFWRRRRWRRCRRLRFWYRSRWSPSIEWKKLSEPINVNWQF